MKLILKLTNQEMLKLYKPKTTNRIIKKSLLKIYATILYQARINIRIKGFKILIYRIIP